MTGKLASNRLRDSAGLGSFRIPWRMPRERARLQLVGKSCCSVLPKSGVEGAQAGILLAGDVLREAVVDHDGGASFGAAVGRSSKLSGAHSRKQVESLTVSKWPPSRTRQNHGRSCEDRMCR